MRLDVPAIGKVRLGETVEILRRLFDGQTVSFRRALSVT
jgi:hypothetical protein